MGQLGLRIAGDDGAAAVHGGAVGQVPGPVPDAVAEGPAAPPAGVVEGPLPAPLLAVVHTVGLDSGKRTKIVINIPPLHWDLAQHLTEGGQ